AELRVEPVEEAYVLVTHVDVHETPYAFFVEQTIAHPRVGFLEVFEHIAHGGAGNFHRVLTAGQRAERGWNANGDFHLSSPSSSGTDRSCVARLAEICDGSLAAQRAARARRYFDAAQRVGAPVVSE